MIPDPSMGLTSLNNGAASGASTPVTRVALMAAVHDFLHLAGIPILGKAQLI